ncbi:MAG: sigma-70 family RNA polymerase sigma factor [Firmicutes bacterium]|nr:sigma-70 family RNA polymerase sigma factor [Bacillota bacterium]
MVSDKACACRLPDRESGRFDAAKEEELVREHTGLVKSVALRLSYACDEELDDLIQIGYIGLLKAARRFDPERGLKFSTYAVPMIAGEIRSQLRDKGAVKVSRSLKSDVALVRRAESSYIAQKGFSPKLSELSELTGLPRERVSEALTAADAMKNMEDYEKVDLWTDSEDKNITRIDLINSMAGLQPRQRQVIILRYYRDLTQQQVADILGLSQVQIHRIEKSTLKELAQKI